MFSFNPTSISEAIKVGDKKPDRSVSSPKVLEEGEVRALSMQLTSFHSKFEPSSMHEGFFIIKRERAFPKLKAHYCLKYCLLQQ